MRRYRTEIVIPSDRYVGLQLPPDLPLGRAIVTVEVEDRESAEPCDSPLDPRDDIEWWEEFGAEAEDEGEPWGLEVRLQALEA